MNFFHELMEYLEADQINFKLYDIKSIYKYNIFFVGDYENNPKYSDDEQGHIISEDFALKVLKLHLFINTKVINTNSSCLLYKVIDYNFVMNLNKPNIIYHDKFFVYDDVLLNKSILKYILDIICIKNLYIDSLRIKKLGDFHLYEFGISLYRGKLKDIGVSRKLKFLNEVNYKPITFDNKRIYIVLKPCADHFNFVFNFIMVLETNSKNKVPFNLVLNRLLEILDSGNFMGYKFCIKGKYSKENIKKTVTKGKIPLNTISESIIFYMHFIKTRYGLFGIKLYLNINKKDKITILKERKRKENREKRLNMK